MYVFQDDEETYRTSVTLSKSGWSESKLIS